MVAKEYVSKRLKVSEDLAKLIETKKGQKVIYWSCFCSSMLYLQVTRTQAMKKLCAYIKEKGGGDIIRDITIRN